MSAIYIVIIVIMLLVGIGLGFLLCVRLIKEDILNTHRQLAVKTEINDLLYEWIRDKISGHDLVKYCTDHNYKKIAIYGLGDLGEVFYDEMKDKEIEICYIVDKNASALGCDAKIYTPSDELPPVDVMIVTPVQFFCDIKAAMEGKVNCPIVSLEDVIFEV